MAKGPVAVRYTGAKIELLPHCSLSGAYAFSPMVPKSEHLIFATAADLDASFPLGAARLGSRLEAGRRLELTTRLVGRWELGEEQALKAPATQDCEKATHIVAAATVGAFRFYSGAQVDAGGEAGVGESGVGLSGHTSEERSVLNSDGSPELCAEPSAKGPPRDCGALIRLELSRFDSPRAPLLHELGTLDFTPVEKLVPREHVDGVFEPIRFPIALCQAVLESAPQKNRAALSAYCDSGRQRLERAMRERQPALDWPGTTRIDDLEKLYPEEEDDLGIAQLLLIDARIRDSGKTSEEQLKRLQDVADEYDKEQPLGFWARYILAGSGDYAVEERNLRSLISSSRLATSAWPRLRLAKRMLSEHPSQAVALGLQARNLADECAPERLEILDWLASSGQQALSSGELFEVQLDGVITLANQGRLPSTAALGQRGIRSHDFRTWHASKAELSKRPWTLAALYWGEGAECHFRGNFYCARDHWTSLLKEAPDSPYVLPAYQALLKTVGEQAPEALGEVSRLKPDVRPGSEQRTSIAQAPSCGALGETELQQVLDEAQSLAVIPEHRAQLTSTWEVDSLASLAPELSHCAVENPSNGKWRLLMLRAEAAQSDAMTQLPLTLQVRAGDESQETRRMATCVQNRLEGNASLFSTPFQLTIRVAPGTTTSFDYDQGWPAHVRERFACTAGDDDACIRLGKAWLLGEELPREPGQALAIFSAKCAEGTQEACVEEAVLLQDSEEKADHQRAERLLERACHTAEGRGCRLLANFSSSKRSKDLAQKRRLLLKACEEGSPDASACMELWYAQAEGVLPPMNQEAAGDLLIRACRILGHGAIEGPCATPQDIMVAYPHRADESLGRLTCARGIWQGCETAFTHAPNSESNHWATRGCQAGSPDACAWLAIYGPNIPATQRKESLARAIELCKEQPTSSQKTVCDDTDELKATLAAMKWRSK